MPELPEVETVRLGLEPVLQGHVLTDVETRRGDLRIPFPRDFVARTKGRKVEKLWRRAKYLLADLDSGETLVIHLGMSGRMSVFSLVAPALADAPTDGKPRKLGNYVYDTAPADAGTGKHDHVVFETDAPARIIFNDHRRFGLMTLVDTAHLDQDKLFKDIGVEPLSAKFNTAALAKMLGGKKTPIKSALLDQRLIAGLVPQPYLAQAAGGFAFQGPPGALGGGDQEGAEGRHRGRRLNLARPCPGHRRSRQFPASFPGLWPRGQAL
jgi:formamidopyrimidine-DNA glycosylase